MNILISNLYYFKNINDHKINVTSTDINMFVDAKNVHLINARFKKKTNCCLY